MSCPLSVISRHHDIFIPFREKARIIVLMEIAVILPNSRSVILSRALHVCFWGMIGRLTQRANTAGIC